MFQQKTPRFWNPETCCPFLEPIKKTAKGDQIGKNRWFFFWPFLIAPPLNTWGSKELKWSSGIWFLLHKKIIPTGWTKNRENPAKNKNWVKSAVFWWSIFLDSMIFGQHLYQWKLMEVRWLDTYNQAQRTWHGRSTTYIILQPYKSPRCSNLHDFSEVASEGCHVVPQKRAFWKMKIIWEIHNFLVLKPKATRFGNYLTATVLTPPTQSETEL